MAFFFVTTPLWGLNRVRALVICPDFSNGFDLPRADIPVGQTGARRLEEPHRTVGHLGDGIAGQPAAVAQGEQEFLLRRHQLRTVDRHQRLPFLDHLPFLVDEELFDPAVDLAVDRELPAFDVGHQADGPNRLDQLAPHHRLGPHPHVLGGDRVDDDLAGIAAVVADRHQVMAHIILARRIPDIGRVHRRAPLLGRRLRRRRLAGAGFQRGELHAADRAEAWFVADDKGVHAAGILLLFGRFD